MDRHLAWLITGGDQIYSSSAPKLVFWGFAIVFIIVMALAVIYFPVLGS